MNVCVFGGGNIAHSIAAKVSLWQPVTIITRQPQRWRKQLVVTQNGISTQSRFDLAATNDLGALAETDILFISLPQFAVGEALPRILNRLKCGSTVVFVPAGARSQEYCDILVKAGINVVGFQRVPYISRTIEYGQSVNISSDRAFHRIASSNHTVPDEQRELFEKWFGGELSLMSSFQSFAFSNSNPLLHPSRIVVLFRNWRARMFQRNPPFYAEWTDESSALYVKSDREMLSVIEAADPSGACHHDYEDVLSHYGVIDEQSLTLKIRSIPSFKPILSPMKEENGLWVPDFTSRYFTEDIPFGTKVIQEYARKFNVATPTIDYMVKTIETEILPNLTAYEI